MNFDNPMIVLQTIEDELEIVDLDNEVTYYEDDTDYSAYLHKMVRDDNRMDSWTDLSLVDGSCELNLHLNEW